MGRIWLDVAHQGISSGLEVVSQPCQAQVQGAAQAVVHMAGSATPACEGAAWRSLPCSCAWLSGTSGAVIHWARRGGEVAGLGFLAIPASAAQEQVHASLLGYPRLDHPTSTTGGAGWSRQVGSPWRLGRGRSAGWMGWDGVMGMGRQR